MVNIQGATRSGTFVLSSHIAKVLTKSMHLKAFIAKLNGMYSKTGDKTQDKQLCGIWLLPWWLLGSKQRTPPSLTSTPRTSIEYPPTHQDLGKCWDYVGSFNSNPASFLQDCQRVGYVFGVTIS